MCNLLHPCTSIISMSEIGQDTALEVVVSGLMHLMIEV